MKILMPEADTLSKGDVDLSIFEEFGDVTVLKNPTCEELKRELKDTEILFTNKTVMDEDMLASAPNLKYIGECATGFNNIDLDYCKAHGITVTNVPDYSTNAVAQQVFAYILSHYSKVDEYNSFVKDGGWINTNSFSPYVFDTDELCGKTIGLVGYGKIGKAVAKIANAFSMNVLVYTRSYAKALELRDKGADRTVLDGFLDKTETYVSFVSLDSLLKHSDIVSVHCPLNAESEGMFDGAAFSKMRRGAFFINTSRGGVLDEQALADALNSGRIGGAALDVLKDEPQSRDCPLLTAKNCLITPHIAWAPFATRKRLVAVAAGNLKSYLNGNPKNVVNN